MRLEGKRDGQGIVFLKVKGQPNRISSLTGYAANKITSEVKSTVCVDCSIYGVMCKGIGDVSKHGIVLEKDYSRSNVSYEGCEIPGSQFEYEGFDVETNPVVKTNPA